MRRQRIARTFLLCNPLLLVGDDVEQQLLVFRGRHVFLQVLLVGAVVQRFAGLRMKLLPGPPSDAAVELDVGSVKLWLALRFSVAVETLDQRPPLRRDKDAGCSRSGRRGRPASRSCGSS